MPSSVRDVQEHCTVVVWKRPLESNGRIITNYTLTFERDDQSTSVVTNPAYHYYVIQPGDVPTGARPVTVEVCTSHHPDLHIVT